MCVGVWSDLERNLSLRTTREELIRRGVLKDADEQLAASSQSTSVPQQPLGEWGAGSGGSLDASGSREVHAK